MARAYIKRDYSKEISSFKNQTVVTKKKIYNNISATINARIKKFDTTSSIASDFMNEIRKLQKNNPEMFTKAGNLKRSASNAMLEKQFSRLVKVLYTIGENGNPTTRKTAREVRADVKKRVNNKDYTYIKHLQHKAKALGLEKELEKLVGIEAYKKANKKPSDEPENEDYHEEEGNMNVNYESLLEKSGLTPEEWLDATTLGYIGHIIKRYGGKRK